LCLRSKEATAKVSTEGVEYILFHTNNKPLCNKQALKTAMVEFAKRPEVTVSTMVRTAVGVELTCFCVMLKFLLTCCCWEIGIQFFAFGSQYNKLLELRWYIS
jgi:hypothetical protein